MCKRPICSHETSRRQACRYRNRSTRYAHFVECAFSNVARLRAPSYVRKICLSNMRFSQQKGVAGLTLPRRPSQTPRSLAGNFVPFSKCARGLSSPRFGPLRQPSCDLFGVTSVLTRSMATLSKSHAHVKGFRKVFRPIRKIQVDRRRAVVAWDSEKQYARPSCANQPNANERIASLCNDESHHDETRR